jgi:hypothetical protein
MIRLRLRPLLSRLLTLLLPSASVVALAAACGGGAPTPVSPSAPSAASSEPPDGGAPAAPAPEANAAASGGGPAAPGPGQWDTWTKEQKMVYMKKAVMPKMGALFHDFDAKDYAEPRCTLCHGPSAKEGNFKMPNAALPKLPATPEGFRKLHELHPQVVDFMAKQVVPTAAALLGEEPYDPKTQSGFGCFECHTKK